MEKQVDKSHYDFSSYVNITRWCSYWHQVDEVMKVRPESLLIIGMGDSIVQRILEPYVPVIHTIDIDAELSPTYVGSVTDLSSICKRRYDVILCCQVLEHIPFDLFEQSISQLSHICLKKCIVSLPQKYCSFRIGLHLSPLRKGRDFVFTYVNKNISHTFDGEHYWEIGANRYALSRIREITNKYFKIERDYTVTENPYHHFFILPSVIRTKAEEI